MSNILSASIEQRAFALAKGLELSPESKLRTSHTETLWKYRPYEGGAPANQIDWRQSAKGRDILIREHEQIIRRDSYFWTTLGQDDALHEKISILLLGLAYLLVRKDRSVGWLADGLPKTRTTTQLATLLGAHLGAPPCLHAQPLHHAFILIATDLNHTPDITGQIVRTYAAQRNNGLILHCGPDPLHPENHAAEQCYTLEWPLLALHRNEPPEVCLVHLFEKSILATR